MAYRREEVENAASGLVVVGVNVRIVFVNRDVGRLRATSIVKGFAGAILLLLVARQVEGWIMCLSWSSVGFWFAL